MLEQITHEVISLDPAVTSKEKSDYTAIAAVGWGREVKKCVLYEVTAIKAGLISLVMTRFPEAGSWAAWMNVVFGVVYLASAGFTYTLLAQGRRPSR